MRSFSTVFQAMRTDRTCQKKDLGAISLQHEVRKVPEQVNMYFTNLPELSEPFRTPGNQKRKFLELLLTTRQGTNNSYAQALILVSFTLVNFFIFQVMARHHGRVQTSHQGRVVPLSLADLPKHTRTLNSLEKTQFLLHDFAQKTTDMFTIVEISTFQPYQSLERAL